MLIAVTPCSPNMQMHKHIHKWQQHEQLDHHHRMPRHVNRAAGHTPAATSVCDSRMKLLQVGVQQAAFQVKGSINSREDVCTTSLTPACTSNVWHSML